LAGNPQKRRAGRENDTLKRQVIALFKNIETVSVTIWIEAGKKIE
jgi:hypothetical protein